MKRSVKISIIAVPIILLLSYYLIVFGPSHLCALGGGKRPVPGHSYDCEYPAKDAGRKCTYDTECSKGLCLYPVPEKISSPYPQELSDMGGLCAKYNKDKNGVEHCHRSEAIDNSESKFLRLGGGENGEVYCELPTFL
jgi:hypothetical protein